MEQIGIRMLGEFVVVMDGREICGPDCRRGQMWNLLQYLATFRAREIPAAELQAALWPNGTGNAANALKNLVYRLRSAFEEAGMEDARRLILCKRGVYRLNDALPIELDTEKFVRAAEQAKREIDPRTKRALLERAVSLYGGDYLQRETKQGWTGPVRERLHRMYLDCAEPLLSLYQSQGDSALLLALAERVNEIDPFDPQANYCQLRALLDLSRQPRALEYYNYLQNLYYRERGENLPEQVRGLYREIIQHMNNIEIDIAKIKQDISEKGQAKGAFFCDYEVFKEMYRVNARAAARTGQKMFIGLLTLTDAEGCTLVGRMRNRAMDHLHRTLQFSLRRGDIVARFSGSQYVVMIATRNYENGLKVIGRIANRYRSEYRTGNVRLSTTLQPVDTLED